MLNPNESISQTETTTPVPDERQVVVHDFNDISYERRNVNKDIMHDLKDSREY